jgi:hypothetical protein
MYLSKILTILVFITCSLIAQGQNTTQTLRGIVLDQVSQQPLSFVNVVLGDSLAASTDDDGAFRFDGLAIGKYKITMQYIGYEDLILRNIQVNAGKETVINANMEESIEKMAEIVVSADKEKAKPLNEMALLSTRMVSVEETQRYAASFGDPARMANSFAGVVQTDAGNNNITIRGNAPNGLLWRLEGIDIPNPNHFSYVGTSGGGISILSSQLLSNSDFSTGAFAAEYGNALSGIFDIKLRKGNNEKREFTFQLGALGIDAAAEGPFKKGSKSSYLFNYRYSTLGLLAKIIDVGNNVTTFQDLSYNMSFKNNKLGDITFFGLNGLSNQIGKDTIGSFDFKFIANTLVNGLTHSKTIGTNTFLKSALVLSSTTNSIKSISRDSIAKKDFTSFDESHKNQKITFSTKLQHKINANTSLKAGLIFTRVGFVVNNLSQEKLNAPIETLFKQEGNASTTQLFVQTQHKYSKALTANIGGHFIYSWLNKTKSIEPRAAIQYTTPTGHNFTAGYGLHSQVLPLSTYFVQIEKENKMTLPNKNLELSKAHHLVVGYGVQPTSLINIKAEAYYQALFDVPLTTDAEENISLINLEGGTPPYEFKSNGIGRNYGVELTVEKYLNQGFYFTFTNSIYDSKFKGTNGQWYNTRFNGGFTSAFTGGKEFSISKKKNRTLAINVKTIYTGGLRITPIDLDASIAENETVYDYVNPFSTQLPNFFRTDLKIIFKRNFKHVTSSLVFDLQNITDRENQGGEFYNIKSKKIEKYNQVGLLPVVSYKLEF